MAEENKIALAKQMYKTLCSAIEKREWQYEKVEENLAVYFGVSGDIPMQFVLIIDVERQLIRLMSALPFKMSEEKRMEGAIAACVASYGMADGNFDCDLSDGAIVFRMTASFRESIIGEGLFQYLISCSCAMVDKFGPKFLAINKGMLSISDFMKEHN